MSVNVNGPVPAGNPPVAPAPGAAAGGSPARVAPPGVVAPGVVPAYGVPGYWTPAVIASMSRRLAARMIDGLILTFVALLGFLLMQSALVVWLVVLVLGSVYEVGFIAVRGATPGKSAVGLRVIREVDGRVPGWGSSAIRWLIPNAAGLFFVVGQFLVYLSPLFDATRRNQGWYDKAARTLVVKT